jgi:SAM-dependent methyltransferase
MSQRFLLDRGNVRSVPPWDRLSYIVRELPRGIAAMARDLPAAGRVLDYGCADVPYRGLFPRDADYIAADLPGNPQAGVLIRPDGTVPVDDASVDVVLSTQVLEHVTDPATYLAECFRVLRPGGRLLLSTHGTMVWHPDPIDLWRWTCDGLQRAVREPGFELRRFEGIMGLAATGLQLFQDALIFGAPARLRAPVALVMQALIGFVDRFQSRESKRQNALVFILIAEKPA